MARREYDPSVKAACMAALLAGQSAASVAAEYKLPRGTVLAWRARSKPDGKPTTVADVATIAIDKKAEIGTLLIDYLHANISTLRKQNDVFGDPTWLRQQDANAAAILHGVMADKAVRLLEALGAAGLAE